MSDPKRLSPQAIEDALREAAASLCGLVGASPAIDLPKEGWPALRTAYHGLCDQARRAVLAQLLNEEGARLAHDQGASFAPRPRNLGRPLAIAERGGAAPGKIASVAKLARGNAPKDAAPEDAP